MFNNVYQNKKVLITGHTGFKGAWLSLWLSELGAQVCGLSRKPDKKPSLYTELGLSNKIKHVEADILNINELKKTIRDVEPDFLFHLAAQPIISDGIKKPIHTLQVNCMGTSNTLEALREWNHECVAIIVSTDKCYENKEAVWSYREDDPLGGKDPYSASKSIVEIIAKSYYSSFFQNSDSRIKICTVRSGNLIGGGDWSRDRIIPDCVEALNSNNPIELKNPKVTRPWQHVLDSLNGYLKAGQYLLTDDAVNGEAFNFGPDSVNHTVEELINEFVTYWDPAKLPTPYFVVPKSEEVVKKTYPLNLNCDKAHQILDWKPYLAFKESVGYTANWYNDYYRDDKSILELTRNQISDFSKLIDQN